MRTSASSIAFASSAEQTLATLIRIARRTTKPVVAAVGGICMGGGLSWLRSLPGRGPGRADRIARGQARLAAPGGTQRLPRVAGVEIALNMIVGYAGGARELAGTALFDEIVLGPLLDGALAFARKVVVEKRPLKRVRDIRIDYPNAEAFFQFARNSIAPVAKGLPRHSSA